jgi:hypothetical protein
MVVKAPTFRKAWAISNDMRGSSSMIKHRLANLARRHGPRIIEELFKIATTSPNHTAGVLACRELLGRAYGKPEQAVV